MQWLFFLHCLPTLPNLSLDILFKSAITLSLKSENTAFELTCLMIVLTKYIIPLPFFLNDVV
jgi:hypothetical protein